jgi:hypothetical protein
MALKITVAMRCRACDKTYRNPLTHTCVGGTDFRQRKATADRKTAAAAKRARATERRAAAAAKRREAADRRRAKAAAQRKAAADRRRAAAAAKREAAASKRKAAAAKRTAPARTTAARPPHDYRTCTDTTCRRYACAAWKEAFQEGRTGGLDDGYDLGYAAGVADCPRAHT